MIPLPIETERLRMRAWEDGDLARFSELVADPEVMRYITLRGRTPEQLLEDYRRRYEELGYSFWPICERSGEILGEVGFGLNEHEQCPELGWLLARGAWGHGYAAEASRACIDALFAHTGHDRIVALVDTRNARSLRTAERIGMRAVREVEHPSHPHMLFEVTRR